MELPSSYDNLFMYIDIIACW